MLKSLANGPNEGKFQQETWFSSALWCKIKKKTKKPKQQKPSGWLMFTVAPKYNVLTRSLDSSSPWRSSRCLVFRVLHFVKSQRFYLRSAFFWSLWHFNVSGVPNPEGGERGPSQQRKKTFGTGDCQKKTKEQRKQQQGNKRKIALYRSVHWILLLYQQSLLPYMAALSIISIVIMTSHTSDL